MFSTSYSETATSGALVRQFGLTIRRNCRSNGLNMPIRLTHRPATASVSGARVHGAPQDEP